MTDLAFVLYRSETDIRPNSDAARNLMDTARHVNSTLGLTGFLHHEDGFFFQWLEGPAEPLAEICGRLERDPRHFNLTYMWRGTQDIRHFAGWDMGYSSGANESILSWLAEHSVAQREKLAYAAAVLSFLQHRREMTRPETNTV